MSGTRASLTGMTWDHPRAYLPLEAFNRTGRAVEVAWSRQSLADFEARPLETLAPEHDLLVVDHPGLGHALATGAVLAWDEVLEPAELEAFAAAAVGPTWSSYRLHGRQWALPIDAATQVSLAASDLRQPLPTRWRDVPDLAAEAPAALCLGGPHAFLMLLAMCADGPQRPDGSLLDPDLAEQALGLLTGLWRTVDREVSLGDPIAVHEAVAARAVDWCPLAYGYASYARASAGSRSLRWSDAPCFATTTPGSVLGGTGLALSARRATDRDVLRGWVRAFLEEEVQTSLVPGAGGQPAARAAWSSAEVDQAWGGYYSATRRSVDTSWTRPRYDGWVALQDEASDLVRQVLAGRASAARVVAEVNRRHVAAADRTATPTTTTAS